MWQTGFHTEEISKQKFLEQKLDYIHNNPVEDGVVELHEDYLYSSARNYTDLESLFEVELLSRNWKFVL